MRSVVCPCSPIDAIGDGSDSSSHGHFTAKAKVSPDKDRLLLAIMQQKINKDLAGSPHLSIDRTFRSVFEMPCSKRQQALTGVAKRRCRNPIILAQEWQEALGKGKYASPADLSRHIGVSRARVSQILRLLKLTPEALEMIVALGDPLPSPIVTERSLRPIVDLPSQEQERMVNEILKVTP